MNRRSEESSREIEERYLTILNSIEEGYFEVDLDGNLTFFNDPLWKLFGVHRDELMGANIRKFTDQQGAVKGRQVLQRVYATGKPIRGFNWDLARKDGTRIRVESSISLIKDAAGTRVGFRGTVWDITERTWAEEELRRSRERLRNLVDHLQSVREEEKAAIAREIHEELGQVLAALAMDLSWLENRLPEDQKHLLEKTKAMSKLINRNIQTVQRISEELRPGMLDDLGLTEAMEWQAEEFQNRTGIKCELVLDPEGIVVDRDRSTALFRIFREMLTNVARHAAATSVEVRLKEQMDHISLRLRDNGKGIEERQISSGRSFGLMEMRKRAEHFGGSFQINGVRGKGTTVEVRIPSGR